MRPAIWPTKYTSVPTHTRGQKDAECQRKMGNESSFILGPDRPQHHKRIGERPEEGSQGDLVATIFGEVSSSRGPI